MNSDTEILVAEILERSGAIEKCPTCFGTMICTEDEDAEKMAYGRATNAWKDRERGFRGLEREEVMDLLKRMLNHTPNSCPRCR